MGEGHKGRSSLVSLPVSQVFFSMAFYSALMPESFLIYQLPVLWFASLVNKGSLWPHYLAALMLP